MRLLARLALAALLIVASGPWVAAQAVAIRVRGTVEHNWTFSPPMSDPAAGDEVELVFEVDQAVYTDGLNPETCAFPLLAGSLVMTLGSTTIGLANPAGEFPSWSSVTRPGRTRCSSRSTGTIPTTMPAWPCPRSGSTESSSASNGGSISPLTG